MKEELAFVATVDTTQPTPFSELPSHSQHNHNIFRRHNYSLLLLHLHHNLSLSPQIATICSCTRDQIYGYLLDSSWQLHDAEVLGACENQQKFIKPKDPPFHSSSFYTMPPRCVDCHKASPHCTKPAWVAGWHDMRIFDSDDQASKNKINALQAGSGLEPTKFD